jgi:hypothetical protein
VSGDVLWITGPDSVWVAEDHVLALADFVDISARQCRSVASQLARLPAPEGDPWAALDWAVVVRLRLEIDDVAHRAERLARALRTYAIECADQERARITSFDKPRDQFLAAVVVAMGGSHPEGPFSGWGIDDAGLALLGPGFSPGDVQVERQRGDTSAVSQARGVAERIRRIPEGDTPIRIERYAHSDGSVSTEIFIAGTSDWGVGHTDNPFDLESNIALVAGLPAASYLAVELALRRSGVKPGDRVTFVGHSQGGLIAARLAESGRYTTTGLLTVGAPLGTAPVRGSYPALRLTHSDDVVPALGGAERPSTSIGVETHSGAKAGDITEAHSLERYALTAKRLDASPAVGALGDWSGSDAQTRPELFRATRTPGG